MTFVTYVLIFVEAVCCLLLIGVILMQRSKSQGLGIAMGGQMGEAIFGARMGNVLTRVTVVLGAVFLINTTLLAWLYAGRRDGSVTDEIAPPPPMPAASQQVPGGQPQPGAFSTIDAEPLGEAAPVVIPESFSEGDATASEAAEPADAPPLNAD